MIFVEFLGGARTLTVGNDVGGEGGESRGGVDAVLTTSPTGMHTRMTGGGEAGGVADGGEGERSVGECEAECERTEATALVRDAL